MTRRQAWLAVVSLFLSWRTVAAKATPALLRIDLNQWAGVEVTHGGVTKRVTSAEIFEALR